MHRRHRQVPVWFRYATSTFFLKKQQPRIKTNENPTALGRKSQGVMFNHALRLRVDFDLGYELTST